MREPLSRLSFYTGPAWDRQNVSIPRAPLNLPVLILFSFLGVSLTKVLLSSRGHVKRKPILVVCMTNHALDSFLDDLRKAGITKLARMGSNSKENWTKEIQLSALQRRLKRTTYEVTSSRSAHHQVEGWPALSSKFVLSHMLNTPCRTHDRRNQLV